MSQNPEQTIAELQQKIESLELQLKKAKDSSGYGLKWEEKPEIFEERAQNALPLLKEDKSLLIDNKSDLDHIIIEGDNYHALSVLNYTHKGMIDVIYIDPPYNTGNEDFIYNDNYVDPEDEYRHSKWLSFMSKRLKLAKKLLKENGLIFISIDDIELYNLKLLCDGIFGETNFVGNIVNQSANSIYGTKAAHLDKTFVKIKDYILVYKGNDSINLSPLYKPSDTYIYDSHEFVLDNDKRYSTTERFEEKYMPIFEKYGLKVNKKNIEKIMDFDEDFRENIMSILVDKQFGTWPYTKDDFTEEEKTKLENGEMIKHNDLVILREDGGKGLVRYLRSLKESCQLIDGKRVKCDFFGDIWNNSAGYGNINAEGNVKFKNGKKPLLLLNKILEVINNKNAMVLDFFAGSGTTGHSVLYMNKLDGGNRKFILCSNKESTKKEPNKNICKDITYKRIKNVIKGYTSEKGKIVEGLGGGNLRYYTTEFIEKKKSADDLRQSFIYLCDELLCIKEDTFNEYKAELLSDKLKCYQKNNHYTVILYDIREIEKLQQLLSTLNGKISVYIFSLSKDSFEEELQEFSDKITIENIPDDILETYKKIF